ncbi:MAG TPA: hypothetical protein VGQ86_03075 [Candidatus Limnocylindria bacterium]|jgi:hypothetical protein|nr:hypothetical protein [Candidatus Limnocylindria bacterium]
MSGLRVFAVTALAVVVGIVAYQIGLSQGLATTLPAGAPPVAYYGYPHWGFGFGFLGLLFPIFFLFLVFGLFRAAAGGWRGGYGHDYRRARLEELHRELHGEKPAGDRPSSTST